MAPLQALLVDVGGTLVRDDTWIARDLYEDLMVARLAEVYGGLAPPWAHELAHYTWGTPDFTTPVVEQIAAFLAERGHPATVDEIDRICRACAVPLPEVVQVDANALGAMRSARRLGLRIAICSNTLWRNDEDAHRDWVQFGFDDYFDAYITSHTTGVAKPHPGIFERALGVLGAKADAAAMVGDQLLRDVAGGKAVGMRTIWKRPEWHSGLVEPRPDATIASLDQLEPILRLWLS
ncbi:MAG: HAD family hydrolase [Candidatus Limnocylindria bacterium]